VDPYDGKLLLLFRELGDIVMVDDGPDIGKFDRIHHWHVGAAIKYGAEILRLGLAIAEVQRTLGATESVVDQLEVELLSLTGT